MTCFASLAAVFAAVFLDGVSAPSPDLRVLVSFDANNVHVGDPMTLNVDFFGSADFSSIHPPKLSRAVDRKTWKVDDASAKTETYRNARRMRYRVRPLREGVLEFPALEFEYPCGKGEGTAVARSAAVPVHAKAASQVALSGVDAGGAKMPMPDGIVCDIPARAASLGEDGMFAWRKACAEPDAKAFARFDFPEARLNEAACEIVAGNWARALNIYSVLEWRTGQTPAIERGIVAALARKTGDPAAELPMWRRALRPVLAFAWPGRAALALAALAALLLAAALLRRAVRAFAALAFVLFALSPQSASAQSIGFEELDKHMQEMHRQMQKRMEEIESMTQSFTIGGGGNGGITVGGAGARGGSFSFSFGGEDQKPVEVKAKVSPDKETIVAGDAFNFVIELDMPRNCTVSQVQFSPSQTTGLVSTGKAVNLADGKSANPSNVVRRICAPVRYDAPFKGRVDFTVQGMYTVSVRGRGFSRSFSSNFSASAPAIDMEVKPLSGVDQPKDFSGAVGSSFRLVQRTDRRTVETNDVVKAVWTLEYEGYVPPGALPGMAESQNGSLSGICYCVADGRAATDPLSLVYYDTAKRAYATVKADGIALKYVAAAEDADDAVVVDAGRATAAGARAARLLFSPSDDAPEVALVQLDRARAVEKHGEWTRLDDGRHAGWVRTEDIEP